MAVLPSYRRDRRGEVVLGVAFAVGGAALMVAAPKVGGVALGVGALLLAVLFTFPVLTRGASARKLARRLRYGSAPGVPGTLVVDADGVRNVGQDSEHRWAWSQFAAAGSSDGSLVLVFVGLRHVLHIPAAAFDGEAHRKRAVRLIRGWIET